MLNIRIQPILVTVLLFISLCFVANSAKAAARIIKTANSHRVYLVYQDKRIYIPSPVAFEQAGLNWADLKLVTKKEMGNIAKSNLNFDQYLRLNNKEENNKKESKNISVEKKNEVTKQPVQSVVEKSVAQGAPVYKAKAEVIEEPKLTVTPTLEQNDVQFASSLTEGEKKLLPDLSDLVKKYPNLQINDVNKNGDFVGCLSKNDWDLKKAFAQINGKLIIIGTVGESYACAFGINDKKQVVGNYDLGKYGYYEGSQAFLWENNKISKLPFLNDNNKRASASDINNEGVVVGYSQFYYKKGESEVGHAVRWVHNKIEDLGIFETNQTSYGTFATDINERGQIIGRGAVAGDSAPNFVWQNGKMYRMTDVALTYGTIKTFVNDCKFSLSGSSGADSFYFSPDGSFDMSVNKLSWKKDENGNVADCANNSNMWTKKVRIYLPSDIASLKLNTNTSINVPILTKSHSSMATTMASTSTIATVIPAITLTSTTAPIIATTTLSPTSPVIKL